MILSDVQWISTGNTVWIMCVLLGTRINAVTLFLINDIGINGIKNQTEFSEGCDHSCDYHKYSSSWSSSSPYAYLYEMIHRVAGKEYLAEKGLSRHLYK